jgi:4-hydroxyphenylpyruvate dioxygenase
MLEERLPGHGEPVDELKARGILLDGSTDGEPRLLLQIFSETQIGPVFFEFIQRKGDEGFGEGNFTGPVRIHGTRPAAPRGADLRQRGLT